MQENPFKHPESPILHLYERSRQKSQQNRAAFRSRSSSFQDFKVKAIRNAIDRQHIIQKTQNGEKEKELKRQRQLSKYYGIETLRIKTQEKEFQFKNNVKIVVKKETARRRSSDRVSSLLNIKPEYLYSNNFPMAMTYESNYIINQDSENEIERSSCRSSERKVSIASQIDNNLYDQGNHYKKSRFVNERNKKIDQIREEYFENYFPLVKKRGTNQNNNWQMI